MLDTCTHSSKPTERALPRENANRKYGLWMILKKSVNLGSLLATNVPLRCGMLTAQNVSLCLGKRGIWGILVPSLNFAVNLKLLLKKPIENIRGWKC